MSDIRKILLAKMETARQEHQIALAAKARADLDEAIAAAKIETLADVLASIGVDSQESVGVARSASAAKDVPARTRSVEAPDEAVRQAVIDTFRTSGAQKLKPGQLAGVVSKACGREVNKDSLRRKLEAICDHEGERGQRVYKLKEADRLAMESENAE